MSARTMTLALILASVAAMAAPSTTPNRGSNPAPSTTPVTTGPASPPPGALNPEQLKAIDTTLSSAELVVLDLENMVKGGSDGSGCPASVTAATVVEEMKAKRAAGSGNDILDSGKSGEGAKVEWQMYFLCKAIGEKNPRACDDLAAISPAAQSAGRSGNRDTASSGESASHHGGISSNPTYEDKCRRSYYRERARGAFLARAPQFAADCKDYMTSLSPMVKGGDAICAAWGSFAGDAGPLSAAVRGGVSDRLPDAAVSEIVSELTLEEGSCQQASREIDRRACADQQDYRKALAARGAQACRSGLCRAEMGGGSRACEVYAAKFKAAFCSQGFSDLYVVGREKIFTTYSSQAETAITKLSAGPDLKSVKEINARVDRLADLRVRFEAASTTIVPRLVKKSGEPRKKI